MLINSQENAFGTDQERSEKNKIKTGLQIIPEIRLSYQPKVRLSQLPKVRHSEEAVAILRKVWNKNELNLVESFKILFLNRTNRVLGVYEHSQGGLNGTVADQRLVYAAAIKAACAAIILAHNHPSGAVEPSVADIKLTRKYVEVGKLMEIPVLDHLILTDESYYSFGDDGNL